MPHITVCPECGKGYEESSEEEANNPNRLCRECYEFHYYADQEHPTHVGESQQQLIGSIAASSGDSGKDPQS